MNIIGAPGAPELVNFVPPDEYFFGTDYSLEGGNEQGSMYNRNFATIRVQRLVRRVERLLCRAMEYVFQHAQ